MHLHLGLSLSPAAFRDSWGTSEPRIVAVQMVPLCAEEASLEMCSSDRLQPKKKKKPILFHFIDYPSFCSSAFFLGDLGNRMSTASRLMGELVSCELCHVFIPEAGTC